jgi:hypothetical protein
MGSLHRESSRHDKCQIPAKLTSDRSSTISTPARLSQRVFLQLTHLSGGSTVATHQFEGCDSAKKHFALCESCSRSRRTHLLKLIFFQFVFAHFLKTFDSLKPPRGAECFRPGSLFCISRGGVFAANVQEEDINSSRISFHFSSAATSSCSHLFSAFSCAHFLALRHLIYYGTIFIKAMGFKV